MDFKRILRTPIIWVVLIFGIGLLWLSLASSDGFVRIDTSASQKLINSAQVESAKFVGEDQIDLTLKPGVTYSDGANVKGATKVMSYYVVSRGPSLVSALTTHQPPKGYTDEPTQTNWFVSILATILPLIIILGLFWFLMSQMQGGGSKVMQFGKSKAKLANKDTPKVTFADVAGVDEAVEELLEIKEFLAEPAKFLAVGAKIPKGVLLYGPPGTGKTLLARAVAGEAGVPFYSISGSDFVEMFVGVGASRVRDLFEQAKANAPAIVFVDEIDAVGRHRGAGLGGGHDEREQTLNQLLVEMDGFDVKTNVILIAATNRPDILDPALLRPGRFDRQIAVDAPDMIGRHNILQVHGKGKPLATGVDLLAVARRTPGFTGADLANVLNEAALLTARGNAKLIDDLALDEAIDRVVAGPQKRTRIMSAKEKKITAYHEGGHALVASSMLNTDPVTKITILPRGRSLGYTMVMPLDDKYSTTRNEMLDQLAYALGGRVAEEMIFHDPTTGAGNDIEKATMLARRMVTQFGMSERIGAIKLGQDGSGEVFLGRDMGHQRDYSEAVAGVVDEEIRRLIEAAHDEAWHALNDNREVLDHLVLELLEKETLAKSQLSDIFANVVKRPPRPVWLSSERRHVSDLPPVMTPAEHAAMSSDGPTSSQRSTLQDTLHDEHRPATAVLELPDENPATVVIERPKDGHVDPSSD
jgi:cell division protease FtsH